MQPTHGVTSQKSDLIAIVLSFFAGIIQLFLFIIGTLGQVTGLQKLFINQELVPFSTLLSLIIALCIVGIISFFKKNQEIISSKHTFKPYIFLRKLFFNETANENYTFSRRTEKRNLFIAGIILVVFSFIFIISTLNHLTSNTYLFIDSNNSEVYQTFSFMILWILTPVILFVWIRNEIEQNYQFKPESFIPNLIRSLQNQGFLRIIIRDDIQTQDGVHLISAKIQNEDKYFITQFDGKRIIRELSEDEYHNILNSFNSNIR